MALPVPHCAAPTVCAGYPMCYCPEVLLGRCSVLGLLIVLLKCAFQHVDHCIIIIMICRTIT